MCCIRFIYDCTNIITSFIKEFIYELEIIQDEKINNCKPEETCKLINDSSDLDIDEGFEMV